jgi:hypothetical protein
VAFIALNTGAKCGFETTEQIQMMASFNTKTALKNTVQKIE